VSERTVKAQWESYAEFMLPDDCGPVQRQETRRAFYAGSYAMFMMISNCTEHMTDDEGVIYLEGLGQECRQFNRDVREHRA
jgi:hypothetical protein